MSYSQFDEERYILEACPEQGRFLDIGAWHPTDKSNTRALYERGWSGVMIEPSPLPFNTLLATYGDDDRVTLICAAVGLVNGLVKLYATADAVSTTKEKEYSVWAETGGYYGAFLTPQITLENISNQFGGFDFINFDAEGISADLFGHAMELGWQPRCICVEIDDRMGEIGTIATAHGYKIVYVNGTNAVMAL